MRRAFPALLLLALVAGAVPAAEGASRGGVSLTLPVWVQYGAGTGTISSPAALCDAAIGPVLQRLSDRIGFFAGPAWTRDGAKVAFVAYDRATHRYSIQAATPSPWQPAVVARSTAALGRPTWSPDGARLAYTSRSSKAPGIYAVKVDGTGNSRLYPGLASTPSWSPDGAKIAFAANGIRLMDASGANVRMISSDGTGPTWSPDGKRIAFVAKVSQIGDQDVFTVSADGSGRRQLSHLSPSASGGITYVGAPAWSPDGLTIAAVRTVQHSTGKGYYYDRDLVLLDLDGAATSVKLPLEFGDPAWRPASPPTAADAGSRPCAKVAGDGGVRLVGSAYDDLIVTGSGNDSIDGGAGDDWIEAEQGDDTVIGGPGRDEIWSGPGTDRELVRDGARDVVHCGDFPRDVVEADRADLVLGRCRAVKRA